MIVAVAISLRAQQPRFDARSRLVLVPVTVTDLKGRSIDGLGASDFVVLDNGRPQTATVDTIDTGVAPIALIVAVQSSGISAAALEKTRRIGAMIQPLVVGAGGCAGLVSFARRITWLAECTKDADKLSQAFSKLQPAEHKEARLLDAAQSAIEHLKRQPNARRILLLISESRDRGSETALDLVTVAAQANGVTVYAATYSAILTAFTSKAPVSRPERPAKTKTPVEDAQDTMGTLDGKPASKYNPKVPPAEQRIDLLAGISELAHLNKENSAEVLTKGTGGAVLPFTKQKALEEAIGKLGEELHSQYVLSFTPDSATAGYHALQVRLTRSSGWRLRARPGYWPMEPPQK